MPMTCCPWFCQETYQYCLIGSGRWHILGGGRWRVPPATAHPPKATLSLPQVTLSLPRSPAFPTQAI